MEDYYQGIHSKNQEPWNYSSRAAEVLRHLKVLNAAEKLIAETNAKVVDIGCSLGQLTNKLLVHAKEICALDISEIAVEKAKERCNPNLARKIHFSVGNVIAMPFRNEEFSLVLACDGIAEWKLGKDETKALSEIHRVLESEGYAIFTDYLRPEGFESYINRIANSLLEIVEVQYLNDRLWYQFESWFKGIRGLALVRYILSSVTVAKFLGLLSSFFGKHGSRHILIVTKKSHT